MMINRREAIATIAAGSAVLASQGATIAAGAKLEWKSFRVGGGGFFRAPVLITGATEALLIDGGFTLSDGRAVADAIKQSGKKLTTIYVSQSDPDYYFSLGPIKAGNPEAKVVAAPATLAAIQGNVAKKLETWSPRLGDNGPKTLADVVMPQSTDAKTLTVDGEKVEIVEATNLANRRYLWVPSLEAIFGGVMVFSGVHVWTADTPTPAERAGWLKELEAMAARKPKIVVAGHATADAPSGIDAITYTRDYLVAFERELAKAKDSAALIEAMKALYPKADMGVALDIGAKVAKGEMKWG